MRNARGELNTHPTSKPACMMRSMPWASMLLALALSACSATRPRADETCAGVFRPLPVALSSGYFPVEVPLDSIVAGFTHNQDSLNNAARGYGRRVPVDSTMFARFVSYRIPMMDDRTFGFNDFCRMKLAAYCTANGTRVIRAYGIRRMDGAACDKGTGYSCNSYMLLGTASDSDTEYTFDTGLACD